MSAVLNSEGTASIVEDWIEDLLEGWSGLRLYVQERRVGRPADATMDALLSELLRIRLSQDADVPAVVHQLLCAESPPSREHVSLDGRAALGLGCG